MIACGVVLVMVCDVVGSRKRYEGARESVFVPFWVLVALERVSDAYRVYLRGWRLDNWLLVSVRNYPLCIDLIPAACLVPCVVVYAQWCLPLSYKAVAFLNKRLCVYETIPWRTLNSGAESSWKNRFVKGSWWVLYEEYARQKYRNDTIDKDA